jgi:hypothetical protein
VVDELPDGTWDWTVWETGRPETSNFGVRATAAGALADAAVANSTLGLADIADGGRANAAAGSDRVAPFASVGKNPLGPDLIVGGICVRSWISKESKAVAEKMAAEINAAFFALRGLSTEH